MGPTLKLFLPWMFMAAQPARVGAMVPGTTLGQKPSGRMWRQVSATVTPGSTSMMPAVLSQLRMRRSPERSSTKARVLSAASP